MRQTQCVNQTNAGVTKCNGFFLILSISQITWLFLQIDMQTSISELFNHVMFPGIALHCIYFTIYCRRQNQLLIVSLVLSITTLLQRIANSKQSCETNTFVVNVYLIYQNNYCHQRVQVAAILQICSLYPHSLILVCNYEALPFEPGSKLIM